jgi:hypothetical protein
LSPATPPSARACCPAWPLSWMCSKSQISLVSRARTVRVHRRRILTCDTASH